MLLFVVVVVVVESLNNFKRIIIVREADLSEFVFRFLVSKMCVFVSRPTEVATFSSEKL